MARSEPQTDESPLERTIGLSGALTIGMGTMIGAGIFVFPGLAVGRAGMGATLSFAIGTVVAVLIALPTAELATAMPESGGGYYFVSRGLDTFLGAVVGISLTIGLVFAAAFYLVGFGEYTLAVLAELRFQTVVSATVGALETSYVIAIVGGLTLTVISILGTEHVESVQNSLVGLLVAILLVFLLRSGLDVLGVLGQSMVPAELLTGMETALQEAGITEHRIRVAAEEEVSIDDAIDRIAENYDLVVLGEDGPGLLDFMWRPTAEQVAERTLAPVLVVQRPFDEPS